MNYRDLLKKYMEGVLNVEGVAFIGEGPALSEAEEAALNEILDEICSE
ncbi:hypothetical protein [Spirosoma agri]|uniref:Uncharacterized protein n=1 Tax=Spirosoma agri TaxID=1987381 RepID=A0A6M0II45_9BACT|nr:hypothetical protein [Spirosoma agri]NEU67936.1 hypothetical protein [Spirosoma agri]